MRARGYMAVAATIILWAWAVVFIKILSFFLDPVTQNFYRYLSATMFLYVLSGIRHERGGRVPSIITLVLPATFVFLFQMFTVYGLYLTSPTVAALIMRTNAIFVNIMAYILVKEERAIISSKMFVVGLLLGLIGAMGLTACEGGDVGGISLDVGALLILAGTLFWASYVISIRILVKEAEPLKLTTRVFTLASSFFLPAVLLAGDVYRPLRLSWEINLLLLGSGVLCVGLGNFMNYIALKELGASVTSSLQLLIPLFTGIFSYITLGERLSLLHMMFGAMLLVGCGLILKATTYR